MSSESAQHVLVSVLMPVYRPYLPWLEQAITSLLNQSNPSWRLVLSLDGDDPDTKAAAELALRLLNAKQKLIVVEGARSGISNALNRGLVHCKTPFTARLDADDICTPERFASQTAALETNPDLVAVGMQIQGIDHNSKPVLERLHRYPSTPKATLLMGALINTPIAHPVLMMRSDAARAEGIPQSTLHGGLRPSGTPQRTWPTLKPEGPWPALPPPPTTTQPSCATSTAPAFGCTHALPAPELPPDPLAQAPNAYSIHSLSPWTYS